MKYFFLASLATIAALISSANAAAVPSKTTGQTLNLTIHLNQPEPTVIFNDGVKDQLQFYKVMDYGGSFQYRFEDLGGKKRTPRIGVQMNGNTGLVEAFAQGNTPILSGTYFSDNTMNLNDSKGVSYNCAPHTDSGHNRGCRVSGASTAMTNVVLDLGGATGRAITADAENPLNMVQWLALLAMMDRVRQ